MSEAKPANRKPHGILFSFLLPLAICAAVAVAFEMFADCRLIRIEDAYTWRILSGSYGAPDWRVLEMNPLLAQLEALLFGVAPAVPWYGLTLTVLLCGGCAALLGMTARKRGGLLMALVAVVPVCALLNYSMISTTVCAVCVSAGFLQMQEGLRERGERRGALVAGLLLYLFGAALNLYFAAALSVCLTVCLLPRSIRDSRFKAIAKSVPIAAVILCALFGYQSLMFSSPELAEYRANYTLYEKLQHSTLPEESNRLLQHYGTSVFSSAEEEAEHAHAETAESAEGATEHMHADEPEEITDEERNGVFGPAGLTLNDSQLFFARVSSDTELVSPEHLKALDEAASYIETSPSHLFSALLSTLKKPQFLMLIALFVVCALMVVLSSRGRGLTALLAALVAFGSHVFLLMCNYDAFCYIAPFYLAAIAVMLFSFDGEDARAFSRRLLPDGAMRIVVGAIVCVCVVAGCGGLAFYSMRHPTNGVGTIEVEEGYLNEYIAESARSEAPKLFIGDNPTDRYKYKVLEATPERGCYSTMLAGGYDLYSPRYAAMLETFQSENPLKDCVSRDDILYVNIGFLQGKLDRLSEKFGEKYFFTTPLAQSDMAGAMIYKIEAVPYGEYNQELFEQTQAAVNLLDELAEAGNPHALFYKAQFKLDALNEGLGLAQDNLNKATVEGDSVAIAEAQEAFDSVMASYKEAEAAYNEAKANMEAYDAEHPEEAVQAEQDAQAGLAEQAEPTATPAPSASPVAAETPAK